MSAIDKIQAIPKSELAELSRPVAVVQNALQSGEAAELWEYGRTLRRVGQIAGVNLAQFLWLINARWLSDGEAVGLSEALGIEDLVEDVVQQQLGITSQTFKKYTRAWGQLYGDAGYVPGKLRDHIITKPWEHQLLLTAAAPELDNAQWKKVATASDKQGVRDVVKEVRGERTSSGKSITISQKRGGALVAYRKGSKPVTIYVAASAPKDPEQREIYEAAKTRILRGAGVSEE